MRKAPSVECPESMTFCPYSAVACLTPPVTAPPAARTGEEKALTAPPANVAAALADKREAKSGPESLPSIRP